jgi:hypothetical protein
MSSRYDKVYIKLDRATYARLLDSVTNVSKYLNQVIPNPACDPQKKFDIEHKIASLKWLEDLPSFMEAEVKMDPNDMIKMVSPDAIKLLEKISFEDETDEDIRKDAIFTQCAGVGFLKRCLLKYVTDNGLLKGTEFIHDEITKNMAMNSNSKLKTEDLNIVRTKRDVTTLTNCMVIKG